MLTDFPINIDTVCFKLKCELTPDLYEQWETKIYTFGLIKYVQTRRLVGGSSVSFRYYPDFACLSILVDSVPALIYGNSQILYCEEDYQYFKECIVDTLNDASRFSIKVLNILLISHNWYLLQFSNTNI